MSKSESDNSQREFTVSGEFSEFMKGNLQGDNSLINKHAGYIPHSDSDMMRLLNRFNAAYQTDSPNAPQSFDKTVVANMFKQSLGTQVANQAVKDGNISQLKYFTGQQYYRQDASAINALIQLRDRMDTDAYIAYMFGHMGNGKSSFAFLLGELAKRELGYKVYSNVKSAYENGHTDGYLNTYGELLSVYAGGAKIKEISDIQDMDIEPLDDDMLFIFDEGNQKASGYSQDAYETMEKLGKMITLIRKVNGHLIIIGHTGKDVHPHIRRLTTDCIHKVSKKSAKFYEDVHNAEGVDLKLEISGIPDTNWEFETMEVSYWDWSMQTNEEMKQIAEEVEPVKSKTERNMEMYKEYHTTDTTQEMLADKYDLTTGRVSQILSEMDNRVKAFREGK